MNSFPARFAGRCGACDERIHEGDPIRFAAEGGYTIHDDCDAIPTTDPLAATHPVCSTCWLTHPEGTCDR
jgi:hypothetical protein